MQARSQRDLLGAAPPLPGGGRGRHGALRVGRSKTVGPRGSGGEGGGGECERRSEGLPRHSPGGEWGDFEISPPAVKKHSRNSGFGQKTGFYFHFKFAAGSA